MPGMMETVLNIGLNDETVRALATETGDERFAWDSYRRLLQMFGRTVLDVQAQRFDIVLEKAKADAGVARDIDLTPDQLRDVVAQYQEVIASSTGQPFPQDPLDQLDAAVLAVFRSWDGDRAKLYRRQEGIADDLGTAVNVMAMVFGNRGEDSGTGVAFTRDPASGAAGAYGDYLPNAQGEDVVAGIRNTMSLDDLAQRHPEQHAELLDHMNRLETHYRDLCDIEFTIERGRLWMLQTRVGKRTPEAAFRIAVQLVDEKLIDLDEALRRVSGAQLARLMFPQVDPAGSRSPVGDRGSRLTRCRRRPCRLRLQTRGRPRSRRREGRPRAPGDEPGRPRRHDRRPGHPHQPRRQDVARGGRRPRHGAARVSSASRAWSSTRTRAPPPALTACRSGRATRSHWTASPVRSSAERSLSFRHQWSARLTLPMTPDMRMTRSWSPLRG